MQKCHASASVSASTSVSDSASVSARARHDMSDRLNSQCSSICLLLG
jgi:hypothetical protein